MLNMQALLTALVVINSCHTFARRIYDESLQSLSLLGSHFGSIDIPAEFDFVIIGGGTAGLTIANRLSEKHTVAIIEAGGFYEIENSNLTEVPSNCVYYLGKDPLWNNPLIDWAQYTTPQPALNNGKVLFSQGHTLGGGSTRNFMWYQRGAKQSYKYWATATGDSSWEWENFLPFLKKPVEFTPPQEGSYQTNLTPNYNIDDYDPNGGPLQVSYPNFISPSASYIGAGLSEIGLKDLPGMVDGNLLGWTGCATTIDPLTQTRSSSETSMLREAINRDFNTQVYTHTLAKRILFDKQKRAKGVEVETAGLGSGSVRYRLQASKEVIVSAGAFRSPQLLMVSGIGPPETLEKHDIEVVADRKGVGQNLWDHIWVAITREFNVLTSAQLADFDFLAAADEEYVANRTGINTNPGGTLIAFEKLPEGAISKSTLKDLDDTFGGDWPHLEYFSQDGWFLSLEGV